MSIRSDRPAHPWPTLHTLPAVLVASALLQALGAGPGHAASGDIYRTVQADGTLVFTDRAGPGATLVKSHPPSVVGTDGAPDEANRSAGDAVTSVRSGKADGGRVDDKQTEFGEGAAPEAASAGAPDDTDDGVLAEVDDAMTELPIERVEIASPPPDATLVDPVGPLLVEVGTAPGSLAASGLVAEALIDGEVVASGPSPIAVPSLDRGEHQLAVRLVDADGTVAVESGVQALYVRRTLSRPSIEEEH